MPHTLAAIQTAEQQFEQLFANTLEKQNKLIGGGTGGQLNMISDANSFVENIAKLFGLLKVVAGLGSIKTALAEHSGDPEQTLDSVITDSNAGRVIVGLFKRTFNRLLGGENYFGLTPEDFAEDIMSLSITNFNKVLKFGPGLDAKQASGPTPEQQAEERKKQAEAGLQIFVDAYRSVYGRDPAIDPGGKFSEFVSLLIPHLKESYDPLEDMMLNEGLFANLANWATNNIGKLKDIYTTDSELIPKFRSAIDKVQNFVNSTNMNELKNAINSQEQQFENLVTTPQKNVQSKTFYINSTIKFVGSIGKMFTQLNVLAQLPSMKQLMQNSSDQQISMLLDQAENSQLNVQINTLIQKVYNNTNGQKEFGKIYTQEQFRKDINSLTPKQLVAVVKAGPSLDMDKYLASETQKAIQNANKNQPNNQVNLDPNMQNQITAFMKNLGIANFNAADQTKWTPTQKRVIDSMIKANIIKPTPTNSTGSTGSN